MNPKQIIVVRKDLKMKPGKLAAQVAHASMGALLSIAERNDDNIIIPMKGAVQAWLQGAFTKVCVAVTSEEELDAVYVAAQQKGIPCALIVDNGLTVFGGVHTKTCCGIGPADPTELESITAHLKLL